MIPTAIEPPTVDVIKAAVQSVCEAHRDVARIDLFGSVARGAGRSGSDVDLLVDFLPGSGVGLFEMGALKEDIEERLGCRVDLLGRRGVENSKNQIRRAEILGNCTPVYAR